MYIQIIDWGVSALTVGSFIYASHKKQRINESLQFNIANLIAGFLFMIVGIKLGIYGMVIRQLFFASVAGINLYNTYHKNKRT